VTKNLSVYRDKEILRYAQNDILLFYMKLMFLISIILMILLLQEAVFYCTDIIHPIRFFCSLQGRYLLQY